MPGKGLTVTVKVKCGSNDQCPTLHSPSAADITRETLGEWRWRSGALAWPYDAAPVLLTAGGIVYRNTTAGAVAHSSARGHGWPAHSPNLALVTAGLACLSWVHVSALVVRWVSGHLRLVI